MTADTRPCPTCPVCQSHEVEWLEATSRHAQVDFCRCTVCGHAFSVTRDTRAIRHITELPE